MLRLIRSAAYIIAWTSVGSHLGMAWAFIGFVCGLISAIWDEVAQQDGDETLLRAVDENRYRAPDDPGVKKRLA